MSISATQASQIAAEIERLCIVAKNYCAKLNGEESATDADSTIQAALRQDEVLREQGDAGVIVAAFKRIADLAAGIVPGVVADEAIKKAEPLPEVPPMPPAEPQPAPTAESPPAEQPAPTPAEPAPAADPAQPETPPAP